MQKINRSNIEELIAAIRANPDEYRILKQALPFNVPKPTSSDYRTLMITDVEATSTNPQTAEIIALAMLPVYYHKATLEIIGCGECEQWYNEPSCPIPFEVRHLTGISDRTVAGHRLDYERINELVAESSLMVAHHSAYDRQILERYIPAVEQSFWACTMSQIPWYKEGFDSTKLRHIGMELGFFYEAHRADADCVAVANILNSRAKSGASFLSILVETARQKQYTIALTVPFSVKEDMKNRKYKWNYEKKTWDKTGPEDVIRAEIEEYMARKSYGFAVYRESAENMFTARPGTRLTSSEIVEIFTPPSERVIDKLPELKLPETNQPNML